MAETIKPAWVAIPSEEEARPILGGMPYDFGFIPGMGRLLMAHPNVGPAFYQLYSTIMFAPEGALDRQEREMVAAVASAAQDCYYWTQSHTEFLRVEGGNQKLVEAIRERRWRELGDLEPRTRALCEVAEKLSATPTRMTEADWAPLRALGFEDQACLEVNHIVSVFNYLTRLADGMGLQIDEQTERAATGGEPLQRG